jgi:hypothetical protein
MTYIAKLKADIPVRNEDPHGQYEMGRYIGRRHSLSEASSEEVFTVVIGDSPDPTISHDPNTITYISSEATHAVDESIIHKCKSINGKPCLRPKHAN